MKNIRGYSALWDCCVCFTCRVFGNASKKNYFSKGFSDWKHAFGAGKGLGGHKASKQHEISYSIWLEKKKREDTGTIISNSWRKSSLNQLKWLEAIFLVTRHLASNGLPFRGDVECYDVSRGLAGGLFLNTFSDLLFYFQPELKEIALRLPKISSYVTKDIQIESISVLAELVHDLPFAQKINSDDLPTCDILYFTNDSEDEYENDEEMLEPRDIFNVQDDEQCDNDEEETAAE